MHPRLPWLAFVILATVPALVGVGSLGGWPGGSARDPGEQSRVECAEPGECDAPSIRPQTENAEEELAAKYAPIVYLKEQESDCDSDGEAFDPIAVELLFDPALGVTLRQNDGEMDPIVTDAPTAADLFGKGEDFYLDFPGDPRKPGCTYEQDYQALRDEYPFVAYAHIQREPGFSGLALQYYFFYYFNDWNNTHEGDWEMIQLAFDADTAAEALTQDPARVAYAQHASGELADWDDDKLQKEDGHPVVYVPAGSHPSHYESAVYFGLGEDGAGFGCDDATSPSRRVALESRLLPDEVTDPSDPFAWLEYEGQWGEKDVSFWNGPTGPKAKDKWEEPFTWQEDLLDGNVQVPGGESVAPNAVGVFCDVVEFGSGLLSSYTRAPVLVGGSLGLVALLGVGLVYVSRTTGIRGVQPLPAGAAERLPLRRQRDFWQIVRASASIYRRHWWTLLLIGIPYLLVGAISGAAYELLANNPPFGPVLDLIGEFRAAQLTLAFAIGAAETATAAIIVTAAVIASITEVEAGRSGDAWTAYRMVWQRLATLLAALFRSVFHVTLFGLTIVGLPWAVNRTVRWYFLPQAVMLQGNNAKQALASSATVVEGSWWRTFGITFLLGLAGAIGPTVGIVLLLFASASLGVVNGVSGVIYVALIPFVATALTLLYFDLEARQANESAASSGESPKE